MSREPRKRNLNGKHNHKLASAEELLTSLSRRLDAADAGALRHPQQADAWRESPEWQGGGVIITSDFAWEPQTMADGSKLAIRTHHAASLTWLFLEIRDAFSPWLSFSNKFGFFGSFAEAALDHLAAHQPEAKDPRPLLRAVLPRAFDWLTVLRKQGHIPDNARCVLHLRDAEGRQRRINLETGEAGL